jgi:hypothetical protein
MLLIPVICILWSVGPRIWQCSPVVELFRVKVAIYLLV